MRSRLDTVSTEFAELVREATDDARRRAVVAACTRAVENAAMSDHDAQRSIEMLRGNRAVSDIERAELVRRLGVLQNDLDEAYFSLQERQQRGERTTESALTKFLQARAIAGLVFALRGDIDEAIYEACSAVSEPSQVLSAVRSALSG